MTSDELAGLHELVKAQHSMLMRYSRDREELLEAIKTIRGTSEMSVVWHVAECALRKVRDFPPEAFT